MTLICASAIMYACACMRVRAWVRAYVSVFLCVYVCVCVCARARATELHAGLDHSGFNSLPFPFVLHEGPWCPTCLLSAISHDEI